MQNDGSLEWGVGSVSSGNLFVIAAPSGAGKTSLVKALSESDARLKISVSHTTRKVRPGEINGQNYFFVNPAEFQKMVANKAFLEHAVVFGNHYGTSKKWVCDQLASDVDVILEIDWQGASQIQQLFSQAILIFILPPSMKTLKMRLEARQQDNQETIAERMEAAQNEISHYDEFDYLVVNDQFDVALCELKSIVCAARLETSVQAIKQIALLENLLKKQ